MRATRGKAAEPFGLLLRVAGSINRRLRIVATAEDSEKFARVDRELDVIEQWRRGVTDVRL
jgi:hypothetical protein